LVIGAVIHELTHAALELRFGDPTPRRDGRMTIDPRLFFWMEQYRVALYAAVIVVTVALPQLTRGLVNPLATATIGTATLLRAHAVEPGVTPLFLGLPNVFTLF
jgi:hypothetical protein